MDGTANSLRIQLSVLHKQVALFGDRFFCALGRLNFLAKNRDAHLITNQVRTARNLNQLCMFEAFAQLTHKSLLNRLLILSLVIEHLHLLSSWQSSLVLKECLGLSGICVLLVTLCCSLLMLTQLFELVHHVDTPSQSFCRFSCHVHFVNVSVHLAKVVVHEVIHNLGWQVDPNVQNARLISPLESLLQILFNS